MGKALARLISAIAGAVCLSILPAKAETREFRARYSVSFLGLPVGTASFDSSLTAHSYAIEGTFASAGLARLFDRTKGTTSVSGRIRGETTQPQSFELGYVSGGKQTRTSIEFQDGNVAKAENKPQPKRDPSTWIKVPSDELMAAFDPLSWTLVRAASAVEVCGRTVRLFDGEMRANLRLVHRETVSLRGFEGEAVTCDAQFVPVAGYRKGRKQIEYLRDKSRMTVTFARLADTGFYTPVDATIGTQIGPVRVSMQSIEAR